MSHPENSFAYLKPPHGLWLALGGSAALHLGLVLALVLGGLLRDSRASQRNQARITALLRKGKPRPKEWLPRKTPAPAPAPPRNVRPDKKAKASKKTQPRPRRRTPVDYSQQMKDALASLTRDHGGKPGEEPEGSPEGVEGGNALVARKGQRYMTQIYKAVKSQYAVPQVIPPSERLLLRATVVITVDARGNLKDFHFEKRSDNHLFDSAIEAAVRRASPFPPPPAELADQYASEGIGLEFTP